jgi:hypothetical protein
MAKLTVAQRLARVKIVDDHVEIILTKGFVAVCDLVDFERVKAYAWYAQIGRSGLIYARNVFVGLLHRFLMSAPDVQDVDHWDHNGLNNRRSNLRLCTGTQNQGNSRKQLSTTSSFKGVTWHKHTGKWQTRIRINGKLKYVGLFTSEVEAARAYNQAALEVFGPFACTNLLMATK